MEGLWQALKIIDGETDFRKLKNRSGTGLKRSSRGKTVSGHFVGPDEAPLAYAEARRRLYVPAYLRQLEQLEDVVEQLRALATRHKVALVDYTDADVDDLSKPLAHAAVLRHVLLGRDPLALQRAAPWGDNRYSRGLSWLEDKGSEDGDTVVSGATRILSGITPDEFRQYATKFSSHNLTVPDIRDIMTHTVVPRLAPSLRAAWESLTWGNAVSEVATGQGRSWQYIESSLGDQEHLPQEFRALRAFSISFYFGSNFADTEAEQEIVIWMAFKYLGPPNEVKYLFP